MTAERDGLGSCLAWPFVALWRLLTLLLELTGRLLAAVLGIALMIMGIVLIVSVLAAPIGVPLVVAGLLLTVRAIF